jgi:hypothetical protein
MCPPPLLFRNLFISLTWISNLISMTPLQILASSKRAKRVIDLTGDDDDDGEGGDGDFTEVSWRTVRLILSLRPETSAPPLNAWS